MAVCTTRRRAVVASSPADCAVYLTRDTPRAVLPQFPHTAYVVAGTQADHAAKNSVHVIKVSAMRRTLHDSGECVDQRCMHRLVLVWGRVPARAACVRVVVTER